MRPPNNEELRETNRSALADGILIGIERRSGGGCKSLRGMAVFCVDKMNLMLNWLQVDIT
jgi:hypothetical protein